MSTPVTSLVQPHARVPALLLQLVVATACIGGLRDAAAVCSAFTFQITSAEVVTGSAYFYDPCTITSTGTLTVVLPTGAMTVASQSPFTVHGTLTNHSLLTNTTSLVTGAFGVLNNTGSGASGGVRNFGFIRNDGTANNSGAWLDAGTFTNNGTLNNTGAGLLTSLSAFSNAGIVNNDATLTSSGTFATLTNTSTGTVNNRGAFTSANLLINQGTFNGIAGSITNSGTFDHYGTLANGAGSTLSNSGSLTAYGSAAGAAAFLHNQKGGTFSNSGVLLLNTADSPGGAGALLKNEGTLDNSGQVGLAGSFGGNPGPILNTHGKLNNLQNGSLVLGNGSWLRVVFDDGAQAGDSVLTNHGGISNGGFLSLDPGAQISNQGMLDNRLVLSNGGTVSNAGTLRNAVGALISNNGLLLNQAGAPGVAGGVIDSFGGLTNNSEVRNMGGAAPGAAGAVLNNHGNLDNRVLLENRGGIAGGGGAVLNNLGTLTLQDPSSVLQNGGTIQNSGSMSFAAVSAMTNLAGGVFANLGAGTMTVLGTIVNDGAITTAGNFNVEAGGIVSGAGTFETTGGTTRNDGEISASGGVSNSGGIWTGTGTWDPPTVITVGAAGIVQPGNGVGTMTFIGDTLFDGVLDIEVAGLSFHDALHVVGSFSFGADARVHLVFAGYVPQLGDQFVFLDADSLAGFGNVAFSFDGLPGGYAFELRPGADGGLAFTTTAVGVVAVPEPSTSALMLAGMAAVGVLSRRARRGRCRASSRSPPRRAGCAARPTRACSAPGGAPPP